MVFFAPFDLNTQHLRRLAQDERRETQKRPPFSHRITTMRATLTSSLDCPLQRAALSAATS
jgi:hypothetical protein